MSEKKELGDWGEERAARYLRLRGYSILGRNFRCRQGEIDIIAAKGAFVVFVEVKLRKNADFGEAREFVTYSKQPKFDLPLEKGRWPKAGGIETEFAQGFV